MGLLVLDQGEEINLKNWFNIVAPQDLVLKLYKNDYTPVRTSNEGNFTEADYNSYAHYDITPGDWVITPGAPTQAVHPLVTFLCGGVQSPTQQIYGYYVIQVTSGKALWAERFSNGPYPMAALNDAVKVIMKMDCRELSE